MVAAALAASLVLLVETAAQLRLELLQEAAASALRQLSAAPAVLLLAVM